MATSPLGEIILNRRKDLGLTREQVVVKVGTGLSVSTLIRLEIRGGMPRVETLAKLASALDLSLDELLAETVASTEVPA